MKAQTKKRIAIIMIWLVFLALTSAAVFSMKYRVIRDDAKEELTYQSAAVANQMDMILENDFITQIKSQRMEFSKLKALSKVLDLIKDDSKVPDVLQDFMDVADVYGLSVYDRDGNVLYHYGEDFELEVDQEVIAQTLDRHVFQYMDEFIKDIDLFRSELLSIGGSVDNDTPTSMWSARNDSWLLATKIEIDDDEKLLTSKLSWRSVISNVRIGREGYVIAVDDTAGVLLVNKDRSMEGHPVESLNIRTEGSTEAATPEVLKNAFSEAGSIGKIQLDGQTYYATRVNVDGVFMLAVLPLKEIIEDTVSSVVMLLLMVLFISGVFMLYAFFHVEDTEEASTREKGRLVWNRILAGKLAIVSALTVIMLLICGTLVETMISYAEIYRYSSKKADNIVEILDSDLNSVEKMKKWISEDYLIKCRIAGCLIKHLDDNDLTKNYLEELSEQLGVRYVYIFDANGKIKLTNSPYDKITVKSDSPFYLLLEGREELAGEPEYDEVSGKNLQRFAVSLRGQDNELEGILMLVADETEIQTLTKNLGPGNVFNRITLSDDTYVMRIEADDLIMKSFDIVNDGNRESALDSYDITDISARTLGLDDTIIRDQFNGNLKIVDESYFASVRRVDDNFFVVMKLQSHLEFKNWMMLLLICGASVIYIVLIVIVSCLHKKKEEVEQPEITETESEQDKEAEEMGRREDDVLAMLGSIINRNKPYFETRWPDDSIKWKDKTTDEKFSSSLRLIVVFVAAAMIIYGFATGDDSSWHYFVSGEWEKGFNLYSLVSCGMIIFQMIVLKMIVHKILFLTARAVDSKGETICHLMDSFLRYALAIAAVFLCMANCGVNTTALSLTGGVVGVVFGIGCQNVVADILAGILMTFEGVVRAGDFVSYNGQFGVILSIGVRTLKLKWFGEITAVRNNDFKTFVYMPSEQETRVVTYLNIDLNESIERVEEVIQREIPRINEKLCEISDSKIGGPKYRGVQKITENCVVLSFAIYCKGMYYGWMNRTLNGELKRMCERNGINLAKQQVVINEPIVYPDLTVLEEEAGIAED